MSASRPHPTVPASDAESPGRETITACMIVLDEEGRLGECLASIDFCDETVVVDSGSSDATVAVAQAHGARVVSQSWLGFAAQRNVALDHASGQWVLEIDADERVTPLLRTEIREFAASPPAAVEIGALPRRELFLGARLGPAGKYPSYRFRLFRSGLYRHDESLTVHEGLTPRGRTHVFSGDLEHLLAGSWAEAFRDTWRYAGLEAGQHAPSRSVKAYIMGVGLRPLAKLGYRVLVDGAWRDGARGLALVTLESIGDALVWIRLLRRWDVTEGRRPLEGHFGRRPPRAGAPRILGVAAGKAPAREVRLWLEAAARAGADTAIVTDVPPAGDGPSSRLVPRLSTLWAIRALDAEVQLRPPDALVLGGVRAQRVARLLPRHLRGGASIASLAEDAPAVVARLDGLRGEPSEGSGEPGAGWAEHQA